MDTCDSKMEPSITKSSDLACKERRKLQSFTNTCKNVKNWD